MKISILHPSRSRAKESLNTAKKWLYNADSDLCSEFEYILSLDTDDKTLMDYAFAFENFGLHGKIFTHNNKSAIEAINNVAKIATGDLFVVISDDFDCPDHWDTLLLKALKGKSDFCAKTDDGLQPTLITMPIMDRVYYERYGYVYHSDFLHMFADQELTAVAMMTGKYIKLDLSFPHLHYSTGKSPKDEVNVRNDMTWKQGRRLFDKHLENNFGIENPVMAYSDIKWR